VHGTNLLADLPGTQPGRQLLVVAHLDTVATSPGADDNASGVAALLEGARLLARLPNPPRVRLAVTDLEELASIGSRALANNPEYVRDLDLVVALEAVGTFTDTPDSQHLGGLGMFFPALARHVRARQRRGDFLLAVCRATSADAAQTLTTAAASVDPPLPVLTVRDPRHDGWKGRAATWALPLLETLDRSDHSPFWHKGIPALMVTTTATFRNHNYHRPGDRPDTLDYPRLTAVATSIATLATTRPRPEPTSAENQQP
jgi:Zn-dependent M28 family amino/carboxypeptidase